MTKKTSVLNCYTDAGWRKWNEKPVYLAHVIKTEEGDIVNKKRINEVALSSTYVEYLGLIYAMEYCLRTSIYDVHFMNDNQTMVYQVQGKYRIKTPVLIQLYDTVMELWDCFTNAGGIIRISWVKRESNQADKYVKEVKNG